MYWGTGGIKPYVFASRQPQDSVNLLYLPPVFTLLYNVISAAFDSFIHFFLLPVEFLLTDERASQGSYDGKTLIIGMVGDIPLVHFHLGAHGNQLPFDVVDMAWRYSRDVMSAITEFQEKDIPNPGLVNGRLPLLRIGPHGHVKLFPAVDFIHHRTKKFAVGTGVSHAGCIDVVMYHLVHHCIHEICFRPIIIVWHLDGGNRMCRVESTQGSFCIGRHDDWTLEWLYG